MIVVGPNQQYTSFTQAVFETVNSGIDILVYPGIYDIKKEYQKLFHKTDFNDQTNLGNNFQFGIWLRNRKVTFLPGAKLRSVWDFPKDFSARFCTFFMAENVILEGLDLYAEGTMYGIHDDVWRSEVPYVNEYHNCRIVGRNLFNSNCIGGGVTKNTRIIIDNCYFDNGIDAAATIRYHNTDYQDAESDIWISNSYFNGIVAICPYGTKANINAYINNCAMKDIQIIPEPGATVTNVNVYEWNNIKKVD